MEILLKFSIKEETELIAAHKICNEDGCKIWAGYAHKSMAKFIKFAILEKVREIQVAEFKELKEYLKE
ncbi:MAG: hypothetical protein BWK75_01350 [Candidatus Altiarchaeales archaeon A3]|nr:MAG: hypothetical protein BWK75_01350 [Candidatus Altiarchaeales archaeon A3]